MTTKQKRQQLLTIAFSVLLIVNLQKSRLMKKKIWNKEKYVTVNFLRQFSSSQRKLFEAAEENIALWKRWLSLRWLSVKIIVADNLSQAEGKIIFIFLFSSIVAEEISKWRLKLKIEIESGTWCCIRKQTSNWWISNLLHKTKNIYLNETSGKPHLISCPQQLSFY